MAEAQEIKGRAGGIVSLLSRRLDGFRQGSPFSKAFMEGIFAGLIVFALLAVWLQIRSNDTAQRLQGIIPSEAVVIEEISIAERTADPNSPSQVALDNSKKINSLVTAPIDGLYESVDGKQLPKSRIEDDMTPFQAYKKPFTPVAGRPLVSIVIVDFGLSELLSKSMLDNMPPEISLVMSPYAIDPAKWAAAARSYGHEFWLSLPMQTKDMDSGPNTLIANSSIEENHKRLINVLGTAAGYAGLVSQKDHVLTQSDLSTGQIMKQILGRGLAFAESNPDIPAYGLSLAMETGSPYVQNNFWLDADLRPEAINQAFRELELQAARKGKAVAFLRPYPVVINKMQEWLKTADQNGFQIAPLSAMVQ